MKIINCTARKFNIELSQPFSYALAVLDFLP